MLIKGASEYVLESCIQFHDKSTGQIMSITAELKEKIQGAID